MCNAREITEGEKSEVGLNVRAGAAFPSPFAHLVAWFVEFLLFAVCYPFGLLLGVKELEESNVPSPKRRVNKEKTYIYIYINESYSLSMF